MPSWWDENTPDGWNDWINREKALAGGGQPWEFGLGGTPSGMSSGGLLGSGLMVAGDPLSTLRNTPGYQFALEQGLQGVERGAFAKGTGLTGGTLKALMQYGTGLADQTYNQQYRNYLDMARLGYPVAPS